VKNENCFKQKLYEEEQTIQLIFEENRFLDHMKVIAIF